MWPLLDEAFEIADAIGHLQRLWPSAVARAEAGWLEGDLEPHVALLESSFELATECRHGGAMGELAVWLRQAGSDVAIPDDVVGPFVDWAAGDHLGAAAGFRRMGCPYEAASALADCGRHGLAARGAGDVRASRCSSGGRDRGCRAASARRAGRVEAQSRHRGIGPFVGADRS